MPKTVLVTGATGFIGSVLVPELQRAGFHVRSHSSVDGDLARCDLPRFDVDRVIHLAGKSFVPDSWVEPRAFYEANVLGTVTVLEFCRRTGAAITFVSSYVYGHPRRLPIAEDHPLEALNPYGHSKILAEDAVRYYHAAFGIAATIVRPFNVYGPGQPGRFLIPRLIDQALDPRCSHLEISDLRPKRDYVHVEDLVRLLTAAGDAEGVANPANRANLDDVYNVGCGRSTSVADLVDTVSALTHTAKPVRLVGEPRRDEILDVVADISRARATLGWEPRIDLQEGLREIIASARPLAVDR
jgi:nucleoside-diphosphate-sugar epimerase